MPGCLSLFSRRSRSPSPPPRCTRSTESPSSASSEKAALSQHFTPAPLSAAGPPSYTPTFEPLDVEQVKTLERAIDAVNSELRDMSLKIQDLAELGMHEHKTHDLMTAYMEKKGFKVTRHAYGMKTAWEAVYEYGKGGKCVGFNSEMDALPSIGQACGHNLIAIAGVAAALSVKAALEEHDVAGKVILLGTPAEEGSGGKCILLDAGAYKPMDVCLMLHPAPQSSIEPTTAVTTLEVTFEGHTAHAAAGPWEGINAQDAAVLAYTNCSALRQQLHPSYRLHGIIMQDSEGSQTGWAQNVIPGKSHTRFGMRCPTVAELELLKPRVANCFKAAALATGCKITSWEWPMMYKDLRNNATLGAEYMDYMSSKHGVVFPTEPPAQLGGSTDFGDVTYAVPALHPMFGIPTAGPGSGNHTIGFTKAAATPEAHRLTL